MIRVAKHKKLLCFPFDICERSWAEWTPTKWSVIANQGGRLEKNIVNPRYRSYAKLHVRSTSRWFGATSPTRGTLLLYNSTSIYGCRSRQFHLMRFATIRELI